MKKSAHNPVHLQQLGFTLIELSIVIVIIALLTGGVLTGKLLVKSALIRNQVSQIEKYNVAVNTFRVKYNYLPGDITGLAAAQFSLPTRNGTFGHGDNNTLIQGSGNCCTTNTCAVCGEIVLFWTDLYNVGLIEGIRPAVDTDTWAFNCNTNTISSLPVATIDDRDIITVYGDISKARNFFQIIGGVTAINDVGTLAGARAGLTPIQAQAIDTKVDDGLPLTGNVTARDVTVYTNANVYQSTPALATAAAPANNVCVSNVDSTYNITPSTGGNTVGCSIRFLMGQ